MSMSAEIRVNLRDIAYIQVSRRGDTDEERFGTDPDATYTYEVLLEDHLEQRLRTRGGLEHRYGDGALVLLRKALEVMT